MGSEGDDFIFASHRNDIIRVGRGDDTVVARNGNDRIHGGRGNDNLQGRHGNDSIYGDDGDDFLFAGPGNDRLHGGRHDDRLEGGSGDDRLFGGAGSDEIIGRNGDDFLHGGPGNDIIRAGLGRDVAVPGPGRDIVYVDADGIDNTAPNIAPTPERSVLVIRDFVQGQDHAVLEFSRHDVGWRVTDLDAVRLPDLGGYGLARAVWQHVLGGKVVINYDSDAYGEPFGNTVYAPEDRPSMQNPEWATRYWDGHWAQDLI